MAAAAEDPDLDQVVDGAPASGEVLEPSPDEAASVMAEVNAIMTEAVGEVAMAGLRWAVPASVRVAKWNVEKVTCADVCPGRVKVVECCPGRYFCSFVWV